MEIVINKSVKGVNFCSRKVKRVVGHILKKEGKNNFSLSINFIGPTKMQSLNKRYRGKDRITDVISFALRDGEGILKSEELGDIFICHHQIKKQAEEYCISYSEEMIRMIAHGVLHLLGYDHEIKKDEARMLGKQEKIVKKFL